MKIKKIIASIVLSCALVMQMGIYVSAADYTLTFTTGSNNFNGSVVCTFYNSATGETTTKSGFFKNGVATIPIDDTGAYNVMDFSLFDSDGSFITQQSGYSNDSITGDITINYDVEGKLAIAEQEEQVDSVAQLASMLGISYEEALNIVSQGDGFNTMPVTTPTVTEKPADNDNTVSTGENLYTFTIDFGNVEWLYDLSTITISHNGRAETVAVKDNKFDYKVENGVYEITADGFVSTKLNIEGNVATKVVLKPERIVYLLKNTDSLNLTFDGIDWGGSLENGQKAFGILPTDSIVIDDKDGKAYRLPLQPGIHEYTLDLGTGLSSGLINEKPTADITDDNPFGIPQTNDITEGTIKKYLMLCGIGLIGILSKLIRIKRDN